MASQWHINMQELIIKEFEKMDYNVEDEKRIGFEDNVTYDTQFKQVDIIAEKGNEIILIEIEDLKKRERELGVGYVELGGILFLSYLYMKLNPDKIVKLVLIFRNNIVSSRKENIERIISEFKQVCMMSSIEVQYRS